MRKQLSFLFLSIILITLLGIGKGCKTETITLHGYMQYNSDLECWQFIPDSDSPKSSKSYALTGEVAQEIYARADLDGLGLTVTGQVERKRNECATPFLVIEYTIDSSPEVELYGYMHMNTELNCWQFIVETFDTNGNPLPEEGITYHLQGELAEEIYQTPSLEGKYLYVTGNICQTDEYDPCGTCFYVNSYKFDETLEQTMYGFMHYNPDLDCFQFISETPPYRVLTYELFPYVLVGEIAEKIFTLPDLEGRYLTVTGYIVPINCGCIDPCGTHFEVTAYTLEGE